MRKHLIGTILVLAALTACNKEVDTPAPAVNNGQEEVTSGKVTLTFKAAIDEETRTTYANDKTASWAAGDKISVCLTDSESYDVVDFTTEDGVTFTGEVNPGYTTPVSAIYPANEVYTTYSWNSYFSQDDGSVTAVRLADGYELGSDDDPGKFIPLIGSYDGETMTFHHFCNTLKVTLTNIPEDAAYFTFATNKQKLVSDFSLTGGRMGLVSQEDDVDTSVYFEFEPGSLTTRSFYIPVPDGTLSANSYVALQDGGGTDLFKKRITSSPTFGLNANEKDAIRVLPEVACWTRNENWNAYYSGTYKASSSGNLYKGYSTENISSAYQYVRLTDNVFNTQFNGSAAEYLCSDSFASTLNSITKSYTGNYTFGFNLSLQPGTCHFIIYGLDENLHFTGEYNHIEVVYPQFHTPDGWSIEVEEDNKIKYTVPSETEWQYVSVTKSEFESTYLGNLEYLIYKGILDRKGWHEKTPTSWVPRTGNQTYTVAYNEEYVLLCVGIDDNYRPTGEYCRLDHNFPAPTEDYLAWVGTWTVNDGTNIDTWKISRRQANQSYNITGIAGQSYRVIGAFDNGALVLSSQLLEEKYGTNKRDIYLYAHTATGISGSLNRLIFTATMDSGGAVTATLSADTAPGGYGIYYKVTKLNKLATRDFSDSISMAKQ